MKRIILIIPAILLTSSLAFAHARLMSPAPRNNNAGIKIGPCGGLARSVNPTVVQGGQTLTINWEETINHPGKFIFSLSYADDLNFSQNVLTQVIDTMNSTGDLPHRYTTQVTVPDIDCSTCTVQMIQSMEENPSAPTFYYSCADIQIVKSNASTPMPGVSTQANPPTFGSGCGLVKNSGTQPPNQYLMIAVVGIFAFAASIAFRRSRR